MQIQAKIFGFCTIKVENRIVITRIWNQVGNFGTKSGYAVLTTNH